MNTDVFGNVEQKSGKEASGTTVQDRFKGATGAAHRHRVKLTITAGDDKGNEASLLKLNSSYFIHVEICFGSFADITITINGLGTWPAIWIGNSREFQKYVDT